MKNKFQHPISYLRHKHELEKQNVFHEAGHAAAIYLCNNKKRLPPVFFKIQITKRDHHTPYFSAKVIDGQWVQNQSHHLLNHLSELSKTDRQSYQCAYEADIINLLAGKLAEAKYKSIRDHKPLNINLIHHQVLNQCEDFSNIGKYFNALGFFIVDKQLLQKKIQELIEHAWEFINHPKNWACILSLAYFILESGLKSISSEEVIAVLDHCNA